jgi:hypothetical protein
MKATNHHILIIILVSIVIVLLIWQSMKSSKPTTVQTSSNVPVRGEYYEMTASQVLEGASKTSKDLADYVANKWKELKYHLKIHYKEALIRKLLKFLNNSNFTYLGKIQDPKYPNLILRKTVTSGPSLLQQYCLMAKKGDAISKAWLMNILTNNFNDYLNEQWKMKSALHRAILNLGQNFGFLTGEEILEVYIKEIIDDDYNYVLTALKQFENKEGVNICTGKKSSFFSRLL